MKLSYNTIILLITGISLYLIIDAVNELSKTTVQDPTEEDEDSLTSNEDAEEDDPEDNNSKVEA